MRTILIFICTIAIASCKPLRIPTYVEPQTTHFAKEYGHFSHDSLTVKFNVMYYYNGRNSGHVLCGIHSVFNNKSTTVAKIKSRCIEIEDCYLKMHSRKTTAGVNDSTHFNVIGDSTFTLLPGDKLDIVNFFTGNTNLSVEKLEDSLMLNPLLFDLKGISHKHVKLDSNLFKVIPKI